MPRVTLKQSGWLTKLDKYFVGNAQLLKKLETLEASLEKNSKIIIPAGSEIVNVIGEMAGVLPLERRENAPEKREKR